MIFLFYVHDNFFRDRTMNKNRRKMAIITHRDEHKFKKAYVDCPSG